MLGGDGGRALGQRAWHRIWPSALSYGSGLSLAVEVQKPPPQGVDSLLTGIISMTCSQGGGVGEPRATAVICSRSRLGLCSQTLHR